MANLDRTPGFPTRGRSDNCFALGPAYHPVVCQYGPAKAKVRIAVAGNSHAFQFVSALEPIAKAHGWHITTFVAGSCTLSDVKQRPSPAAGETEGCASWVTWATNQLVKGKFDLVVTADRSQVGSAHVSYSPTPKQYADGYASVLRKVRAVGSPVIAIRDTPAPGKSIPGCLSVNSSDYTECDGTRSAWMPPDPLVTGVKQLADPKVSVLDLADHICEPVVCPAVIGGVPVYFDDSHLTATFIRTLVPYVEPSIEQALAP